jgi:5-formyltetrahydrofolate cyclo-ligase
MDLEASKRQLRGRMRARRGEISAQQAARAGLEAARWITASDAFRAAPTLALYAAIPGEIETRALFEAGRAAGKRVCLPRSTRPHGLEFALVDDWDRLVPGLHSVPEPPADAVVCALAGGDLVIVPGVAFDAQGARLGRGAGYYDRCFPVGSDAGPLLFGLAFSFQVVARVPSGCHDRHMDAVCTEAGLRAAAPSEESM